MSPVAGAKLADRESEAFPEIRAPIKRAEPETFVRS
jgi:hypothetical protein